MTAGESTERLRNVEPDTAQLLALSVARIRAHGVA